MNATIQIDTKKNATNTVNSFYGDFDLDGFAEIEKEEFLGMVKAYSLRSSSCGMGRVYTMLGMGKVLLRETSDGHYYVAI